QVLTCAFIGALLIGLQAKGSYSTQLSVPFLKKLHPDLVIESLLNHRFLWAIAYVPFVVFLVVVIAGLSNGVNLTDGLDGLAIGCVLISAVALTVITYLSSNARFAEYLEIQRIPDAAELTIFCGSLAGASLGFLWYNAHPAEVFMGDVGSLALGGAIGTIAVILKQEILMLSIGGIFILDHRAGVLSVFADDFEIEVRFVETRIRSRRETVAGSGPCAHRCGRVAIRGGLWRQSNSNGRKARKRTGCNGGTSACERRETRAW